MLSSTSVKAASLPLFDLKKLLILVLTFKVARFLDCMCLALWAWRTMAPLRYAAKFDPFLSLDCAPMPSTMAQSKERKGSNFANWQPWRRTRRRRKRE